MGRLWLCDDLIWVPDGNHGVGKGAAELFPDDLDGLDSGWE